MATVSELLSQHFQVRREVSQTSDLANLLLGKLKYDLTTRQSSAIKDLERRLDSGPLNNVSGSKSSDFVRWLTNQYLVINKTIRGVTYYPIHPALALSINGEGPRVEGFISLVADSFTAEERQGLVEKLWTPESLPVFEQLIYNLIDWQLPQTPLAAPVAERLIGSPFSVKTISTSVQDLLINTKEDLLALSSVTTGVQAFVVHAGRLLALSLSKFYLLQAGITLDVPMYAAPAADSHEGVRALAHETLELHRARYAQALEERFRAFTIQAMQENGYNQEDPQNESNARILVSHIFHSKANIIPRSQEGYQEAIRARGSFTNLAYHYYWSHSGAPGRFLRQLHTAQLNMAKKAGLANSRSRYSQWSFYWLAPSLVETLLLLSQARLKKDQILVTSLLAEWRKRYDIAVLIDESWGDIYRHDFRSFGSPETLNEVNQRRFMEILAERGRLRKNSDDFPWVVLKD
jgi:hypothetical protein